MQTSNPFFKRFWAVCALSILALTPVDSFSGGAPSGLPSGQYLEVRSCDIFTGPCFANAEMGINGKEVVMVWNFQDGVYLGANLAGKKVVAIVQADDTIGNQKYQPRSGDAVLIVDGSADEAQRAALRSFVKRQSNGLIGSVVQTISSPIQVSFGSCDQSGCAEVRIESVLEIQTRCLDGHDHLCGNEEIFYPPVCRVEYAVPAMAEWFSYQGSGLESKWAMNQLRGAFLGAFDLGNQKVESDLAMID